MVVRFARGTFGAKRYNNSMAAKVNVAASSHWIYGQAFTHNDCTGTTTARRASTAGAARVKVTASSRSTPTAQVRPNARILLIHKGRGARTSYTISRPAMIPLAPF